MAESYEEQIKYRSSRAKFGISELTPQQQAIAHEVFRILPKSANLLTIVQHWLAVSTTEEMPLELAIDVFLEHKGKLGLSERYLESLRKVLWRFERSFPAHTVSDITRDKVEYFLSRVIKDTPINRFNHIKDLHVFFEWTKAEKYAPENVMAEIPRPQLKRKSPEVLTIDQAAKMLKNTDGQDRAYAVLGMFAGIRPEELLRADWTMVSLKEKAVRLPPEITKRNIGRIIELEANVIAWLKTVARPSGPIFQGDASCLTGRLKTAVGLESWPQNILRHTFATYHTTAFQNPARTALALHSRENPRMLYQHYFRPELKAVAMKFWKLRP